MKRSRRSRLIATAALVGIGGAGAGARADTLVYSFETLYNNSGTIDVTGTRPDNFHNNGGLTTITQDTIGATDATHSMKYEMLQPATFTGAQTEFLPAELFASTSFGVSFDLTVPATGNFTGNFARIGVSAFGDTHTVPPSNQQVQAISAAEQNINLEPGTYRITLPFLAIFNPADPLGSPFSLPFASVFGPNPNQLTQTSWEFFINKSAESPLTVYFDNVQARTRPLAVWNSDNSGNWSDGSKWNSLPAAAGDNTFVAPGGADTLLLLSAISTSTTRTLTVDGPRTIGGIDFNGSGTFIVDASGPGVLTFDVTSGQATVNLYRGNHSISAPIVLNDDTTFNVTPAVNQLTVSGNVTATGKTITKSGAGFLLMNNVRAAGLNANGGILRVAANGGNAGTSKLTSSLAISGGGSFDVNDDDLIVGNGTSKAQIETYIRNARNSGAWNMPGLTSSAARDNAAGNTNLGVLSGAELNAFGNGNGTFSGQSYVATDTLVKYTWNGDTNFSGTVNFDDYVRVDVGFNTNLTGWGNGDFNYSGGVNFDDYVLIDVAFNTQSGTLGRAVNYLSGDDRGTTGLDEPAVRKVIEHFGQFGVPYASAFLAAVPEPASTGVLALLAGTAAGSFRRRRRRHRRYSGRCR